MWKALPHTFSAQRKVKKAGEEGDIAIGFLTFLSTEKVRGRGPPKWSPEGARGAFEPKITQITNTASSWRDVFGEGSRCRN